MAGACHDSATASGVDLLTEARPCPWPIERPGGHRVEIRNDRPNKIYELEILARARQSVAIFHGEAGPQIEIIKVYYVVSSQDRKPTTFPLATLPENLGQTVEVMTTVAYYDATQQTTDGYNGPKETQVAMYDLNLI
jgi:hypothetical protein